jgi:hypothetical protein
MGLTSCLRVPIVTTVSRLGLQANSGSEETVEFLKRFRHAGNPRFTIVHRFSDFGECLRAIETYCDDGSIGAVGSKFVAPAISLARANRQSGHHGGGFISRSGFPRNATIQLIVNDNVQHLIFSKIRKTHLHRKRVADLGNQGRRTRPSEHFRAIEFWMASWIDEHFENLRRSSRYSFRNADSSWRLLFHCLLPSLSGATVPCCPNSIRCGRQVYRTKWPNMWE